MRAKPLLSARTGLSMALALAAALSSTPAAATPHAPEAGMSTSAQPGHPPGPQPLIEQAFRAAYPLDAPSSSVRLAGVALDRFAVPGLLASQRSDQAGDDGGVGLSFSDRAGTVRVLLQLSVMPDVMAARRVLGTELRGVALPLARAFDPLLGDLAYADEGGRGASLVVATQANIAYVVHVVEPGPDVPSAATVAGLLRTAMVVGSPSFPSISLSLPPLVDAKAGAELRVYVPGGLPYKLHADGAYVARGGNGYVLRPFGPGPVTAFATATSDLGCVSVASHSALAR